MNRPGWIPPWVPPWRDLVYYGQRGLHWGVILVVAYVAWKIVPVYAAANRFERALGDYARSGATSGLSGDEIHDNILWRARQLELPLRPMDVQVETEGRSVSVRSAYQVPVELGPWRVVLNFQAATHEQALITKEDLEQLKKALEFPE